MIRDTTPIPNTAKIDTTASVIVARIDELFKVISTKGGISKEMVNSLNTEIIKIVDDTTSKGAVEATVSPSARSRRYSAGELTDVRMWLLLSFKNRSTDGNLIEASIYV